MRREGQKMRGLLAYATSGSGAKRNVRVVMAICRFLWQEIIGIEFVRIRINVWITM